MHVGGDEHELLNIGFAAVHLPERPFMLLGQQSIADPTRAPAGRHTAWAYMPRPQALPTGQAAGTGTSTGSRHRSSASRRGSATGSWLDMCSHRPPLSAATPI